MGLFDDDFETKHNSPDVHRFGEAFILPGLPQTIGSTLSEGKASGPARADHVHTLPTGYRAYYSGTTAPSSPVAGDLWLDSHVSAALAVLRVYTGSAWKRLGIPSANVRYQAGNITLNSTSWANVHASALDLSVYAEVGDILEYSIGALYANEAVQGALDIYNTTSGYYWSSGTSTPRTYGPASSWVLLSSQYGVAGGSVLYTVQSADLDVNGILNCRLRYRTDTATNKTLFAGSAQIDLTASLKNLGPITS